MTILLVAATATEIAPLVAMLGSPSERRLRTQTYVHAGHQIDVLTTGVGMVATAAWCSRGLAAGRYDLALNLGVCGSFDTQHEPGTVVHVASDRIAELGAEDGDAFLTVQALGLLGDDEFPFRGGLLVNPAPPAIDALARLSAVTGITVNTAHGDARSIAGVRQRFGPDVESMEGAAFMYSCLIHGVAFAQVRAVSNVVETRNRPAWKLAEAIRSLSDTALEMLGEL